MALPMILAGPLRWREGEVPPRSYPSKVLDDYIAKHRWHTLSIQQKIHAGHYTKKKRDKIEVITANYPLCKAKLPQKVQGAYMHYTSPQIAMFGK